MAYDNTNTGILGKNQKKEKATHPDITGSINVDGRDYWLNGWQKTGKSGLFYSLSVKPKDASARPAPRHEVAAGPQPSGPDPFAQGNPDDTDTIPW